MLQLAWLPPSPPRPSSPPLPPLPPTYRSIPPMDGGRCAMPGQTTDSNYCGFIYPTLDGDICYEDSLETQQLCENACNAYANCVAYSWQLVKGQSAQHFDTDCQLYDAAALPDLDKVVGSRSLSPPQGHAGTNCYIQNSPPSPPPPSPP
eukprot:scaffold18183_cov57-Phaeocystis_antarctica.AAC.1